MRLTDPLVALLHPDVPPSTAMAKSSTVSSTEAHSREIRIERSLSSHSHTTSSGNHSNPSRASVLASVIPSLRRLDAGGDTKPSHQKIPLLILKPSSASLLDSDIKDETQNIVYSTKTASSTTVITRVASEGTVKTAEIKWPKNIPSKGKSKDVVESMSVIMRGARWTRAEPLLRQNSILSAPRRFNIPNFSQDLKWKRSGNLFQCTTSSVKGPIATFQPSSDLSPIPCLTVYETLRDKYDARPINVHQGVSILLLDFLLVTSILLVTDCQSLREFQGKVLTVSSPLDFVGPSSDVMAASTSDPQWRKVVYGEPLFPKLTGETHSSNLSPTADSPITPEAFPQTPKSDTIPRFGYGNGLFTISDTYRSSLNLSISSYSEAEDDGDDEFGQMQTRPQSPSAESIFYPLTNSSAPSHIYIDPSFYNSDHIPPVPELPISYRNTSSNNSHQHSSHPSSPTSSPSRRRPRELPSPPIQHSHPRPRSTPPRGVIQNGLDPKAAPRVDIGAPGTLSNMRRPSDASAFRVRSRPLPRLPSLPGELSAHTLRHTQSQSRIGEAVKGRSSRPQRSLPPTPAQIAGRGANSSGVNTFQHHLYSKSSEEEDMNWVYELTNPRGLPPLPSQTSGFEMPPPAYNSINFHIERSTSSNTLRSQSAKA